ncbi:MAG: pilus assembly protein PilM, partial [Pirellulales bacterium]|nr:pilus assembly protein PilM [Pirellulales bacterium]
VPLDEVSDDLGDNGTSGGDEDDDRTKIHAESVGQAIRAALKSHRISRPTVLVGVNRQSVEILHLSLPPATDEELPNLVANQFQKESQISDEDAKLDFQPVGDDPAEPRRVTAAALMNDQFDRLQTTCSAAGLQPQRMVLRSYASASLFSRTTSPPEDVCLLVNLVGDEVDLTVTIRGRAVFARTVRLSGEADDERTTRQLVSEIRRTMAVSMQNRLDEGSIEGIYIFGGPDDHAELVNRIKAELSLAAMVIDPFIGVDLPASLVPDNSGAFAPLLGMLLDETQDGKHAIDFLHPRRRPAPRSRRRPLVIAGSLAAALALVGGYHVLDQLSTADADNRALQKKLSDLKQLVKKAQKKEEVVRAVSEWQSNDVNWLDELRDMSLRFPSSRDTVVLRMTLSRARGSGGAVNYSGLVRDPLIVVRMESNMRDKYHDIRSKRVQEQPDKDYTWRFETAMTVAKRAKEEYDSHLPKPEPGPEESGGINVGPATTESKTVAKKDAESTASESKETATKDTKPAGDETKKVADDKSKQDVKKPVDDKPADKQTTGPK